MFLKNSAVTGFMIGNFIAIADGSTVTTGTPTCKRLLDGTGAAMANAASYNADALAWEIDLAAADTNGDMVGYSFTLADCLPISFTFRTTLNLVGTAQTGDAFARLGAPAGASVSADIADVPTVAEFEARTLVAADYVVVGDTLAGVTTVGTTTNLTNLPAAAATAAELAKVPKSDSTVSWNATALAAINAEVDTALNTAIPGSPTANSVNERIATMDGLLLGTVAAGTHVAQSGDSYARLGAPAGASVSADVAAVKAQTAAIETDTQDLQTQVGTDGAGLTALGDTRLANLDATVSSRLATAGYTAPLDAAGTRTALGMASADLDTQLDAIVADTSELQTNQGDWATADVSALALEASLTDIKGATFSGATDSLEALRDRGDAAWVTADVSDLPTNSELATALASADDATLAAIAALPTDADVQTAATAALNAYDPPTNAEMVARTLVAASYFDPAADTVANVTTVATTTNLTNLPAAAALEATAQAILTDTGTTLPGTLATIAGYIDTEVAAIKAVTDKLDTAVELDGAVYRFTTNALEQAPTGGSAPSAADIRAEIDANSTQLAAIVADTNELQTNQGNWLTADTSGLATSAALATVDGIVDDILVDTGTTLPGTLATIAGYVDTEVAAIKAKTDNLPAAPAAVGSAMTLTIAYDAAKTAATQTSVDDLPTNAELATALAAADDATLAAISGLNNLSSAQAQTAAAAALTAYDPPTKAELDSGLAGLNDLTAAAIRAEIDSNSTQLAAIVADTNELQTDWADGGRLDLLLDNAGAAGVPPTVEQIRAEIDSNSTQLAAIVEDTGTTIPGQISAIDIPTVSEIDTELTTNHGSGAWASVGLGAGARTVLVTVDDGTDPLEVAKVRLAQGTETYVGDTNASGQITFNVNDATWTVAITKPGYTFAGATLIVDDDKTPTYSMTAVAVSASGPDQSTGYVYCYNEDGEIEEDVVINIQITATAETDGFTFDTVIRTEASDANGLVEVTGLWIGATYRARRWDGDWHSFIVPDAASFALPAMLGR